MTPNHNRTRKVFKYIILILLACVWLIPIYTLIMTAFKSKADFYSGKSIFELPEKLAFDNFRNAMTQGRMSKYMLNGLIVSVLKVPLGIFIEALAAFSITRLKLRGQDKWLIFFLLGMMLPMQTALVPINVVFSKLNLLNTYFGLFIVYLGFGISFGVLVFWGFFKSIPKEIDESALIDGCNKWSLFSRIIFPVSKPAIATLLISDFLSTWNEYLLASVIINDNRLKTVPAGLMTFLGEHGTDYSYLCAGVIIAIIPVMIVYLVFQQYFVEGMAGAVKG